MPRPFAASRVFRLNLCRFRFFPKRTFRRLEKRVSPPPGKAGESRTELPAIDGQKEGAVAAAESMEKAGVEDEAAVKKVAVGMEEVAE